MSKRLWQRRSTGRHRSWPCTVRDVCGSGSSQKRREGYGIIPGIACQPLDEGALLKSPSLIYTFLLLIGRKTLADVRADMEALHRQTVVVPVLTVISVLLQ